MVCVQYIFHCDPFVMYEALEQVKFRYRPPSRHGTLHPSHISKKPSKVSPENVGPLRYLPLVCRIGGSHPKSGKRNLRFGSWVRPGESGSGAELV